jgi:CRISPR-associated endonuclease/helicase Cas3
MERATGKAERLMQIEALLLEYPDGLSQAEISRRTGVNRSTIYRYLAELGRFSVYETDDGKLAIDRDHYLMNVRLTLHESMALHLAARLMATRTDKQNPHAAAALRKLGLALEKLAPRVAEHLKASADVMDDQARRHDPVYLDVLETLTRAWSDGRVARVWHRLEGGRVYDYDFAPYFIEPYAVGQTTHAIGWREPPGALRTFKLERIQRAELTGRPYTIPADFDPRALLADAWGIWYTEAEPVPVTLKFHPRVAQRVRETRWHRSERVEDQPDGGLIWRARVAEPQEMLPWIRGWGADVEVVGPEELRKAIVKEARRMATVYGVTISDTSSQALRVLECWGKTGKRTEQFHPALFHMLDVGHVARALLQPPVSPRWRRMLAQALAVDADTLCEWLPYFVALHDIGKISSAFQGMKDGQRARLESQGFAFGPRADHHHTVIGQVFVSEAQGELSSLSLPEALRDALAQAIGGHHGRFAGSDPVKDAQHFIKTYEPPEWYTLRAEVSATLKPHLLLNPPAQWPEPANLSTAIMALTGFTILCDWLGSDGAHFPPQPDVDLEDYLPLSQECAREAARNAGFLTPSTSYAPTLFAELFPDKQPPRPLQEAIDAIPAETLSGPCLAILEAPTGEGKTEAALALAHRLAQARGSDELYYALPTTATSNQMFVRLQAHLRDRLGLETQVKLIHGQAFLVEDDLRLEPLEDSGDDHQEAALEWFGPKKRALLAPFGVGTVDQVELAALNVKHTALRMIGLAGKVVIFDEVHAYDMYMTTIVEALLKWLRALDTSVILLSATLPQSRRAALARAYGVGIGDTAAVQVYPSLSVFGAGKAHHAEPQAVQPDRLLMMDFLRFGDAEADIEAKARWLLATVAGGGCVCWMTNTVRRAQAVFKIVDHLAGPEVDRMLLHAQLPLFERERREKDLIKKYGPPDQAQRPARGVVVGTQVMEQSLDLDFDVMVSDLAPIDLLLQRAGRLHRHTRPRPAQHAEPHLWINAPLTTEKRPVLDADRWVYAPFLLLQTWATLADRDEIALPRDYRMLVEAVYGLTSLPAGHPFIAEWQELKKQEAFAIGEANLRLLPEPDPEWAFSSRMARLQFEESENSAAWIVAKTRLGEESVTVIPLEWRDATAWGWPDGLQVAINQAAPRETQLDLLRRQLRISHHDAVAALKAQSLPPLFTRSALLKEYLPLWLTDGLAELPLKKGTLVLSLDEKLGLQICKKGA